MLNLITNHFLLKLIFISKLKFLVMETIPNETLFQILLHLPFPDILHFCSTNKSMTKICDDQYFWNTKLKKEFSNNSKPINVSSKIYYYKLVESYQKFYRIFIPFNPNISDLISYLQKTTSIKYHPLCLYNLSDLPFDIRLIEGNRSNEEEVYIPCDLMIVILKREYLGLTDYISLNNKYPGRGDYLIIERKRGEPEINLYQLANSTTTSIYVINRIDNINNVLMTYLNKGYRLMDDNKINSFDILMLEQLGLITLNYI